ncbi:DUF6185 family protein [Streptomyces sp. NPDC050844]|uniref:DUF6185 family protein n=1 Tax=Streptomyces sp. NPDC050844 TaxID=3155790 RepID=UPI0034111A85
MALVLLLVCVLLWPAEAWADAHPSPGPVDRGCATAGLDKAKASAAVRIEHDGRVQSKVTTRLTVHVPASWKRAKSLLLSEDTAGYRQAMGCLTRPYASQHRWWAEWRPTRPEVTPEKGGFEVRVDAFTWIDEHEGFFTIGPWRVELGTAHWRLHFEPAPGLQRVNWTEILVDPGSAGAESARPQPATRQGATGLVWHPKGESAPPSLSVGVKPSWQRSWAAQDDRDEFANLSSAGFLISTFLVSGLLLYAARRARSRAGLTAGEAQAARTLADWAWVSAGLLLVTAGDEALLIRTLRAMGYTGMWVEHQPRLSLPVTLAAAVLVLAFGRPRRPVAWAAVSLAVPVVAVSAAPGRFGLDPSLDLYDGSPDRAVIALFVATGCVQALTFLGFTAAVWRLARDCGLIPPSRRAPYGPRELKLRYAVPVVVLVTAAVGACYALTAERIWLRISWLSRRGDPAYGIEHLDELRGNLTWFTANSQNWWSPAGIVTCLALLAALRAAGGRPTESPVDEPEDRRLFLLFFPVVVGMGLGAFANNEALTPLWILLNIVALHLATVIASGRAVLNRTLESSGDRLGDTVTAARRSDVLGRARRYREIHAKMRRLDQGQSDDDILQRNLLEREVRGLHTWSTGSGVADRLPAQVSVVDVALSMGPRDTWWANGRRGALMACLFGVPASAVTTWSSAIRGENWRTTLYFGFGLPDTVMTFVFWQMSWVGAGFVLGALWRRLPGRRGPVRALPVAAAFALPVGVDALGNHVFDQDHGDIGLAVVTMLLVLTLTGIALDLDVFRGERRFWQSRLGLLLSIYQMRYFSLQLAYLIAQAVAMLTLWQFFADGGGAPPPKEIDGGGR